MDPWGVGALWEVVLVLRQVVVREGHPEGPLQGVIPHPDVITQRHPGQDLLEEDQLEVEVILLLPLLGIMVVLLLHQDLEGMHPLQLPGTTMLPHRR